MSFDPFNRVMQDARRRFFTRNDSFDPQLAQLLIYVWPRHAQTDATGALARHVRARVINSDLERAMEGWASYLGSPSEDDRDAAQWCLDHPPFEAYTRWRDITTLRFMCQQVGPSLTGSEFDAALADFTANHVAVDPLVNFGNTRGGIIGVSP